MVAGHELSAHEAAPLASAKRLRFARELRGWSQAQLVEALADQGHVISTAAISQFENGQSKPSAATLAALSIATEMPVGYFARRRSDEDIAGFFRALRSVSARSRKRALALAHLVHDLTVALELSVEFPDLALPQVDGGDRSQDAIEAAAAHVRKVWHLGDEPIGNVVREIEKRGPVTARLPFNDVTVDAFSVRFDRPVIMLGNDKGNTARSRFDAAHELGHLLLHASADAGSKQAETEAHWFAGALLLPTEPLLDAFPRTLNWSALLDLKVQWGVSIAALLIRGKRLGLISDGRYVSAMKYMSARGWRKREPRDDLLGPAEQPRVIPAALAVLAEDGTTLADVARNAELPLEDLQAMFQGPEGRPRIRVAP